jgi:hypothetical protein
MQPISKILDQVGVFNPLLSDATLANIFAVEVSECSREFGRISAKVCIIVAN